MLTNAIFKGAMTNKNTSTKYSFLDADQRTQYQRRWFYLKKMTEKWFDRVAHKPGVDVPVFGNRKSLEQEIIDLEDLSLSAYRAMKTLKACLADATEKDDEYYVQGESHRQKLYCVCGKDITKLQGWVKVYDKYFCDVVCLADFERDYEPDGYSG